MAQLIVRKLEKEVDQKLRERAAQYGGRGGRIIGRYGCMPRFDRRSA
jgi:hypothetical protein